MKTTIHTDGFEGWKKRAMERALAMDEGRRVKPSRGITFESPAEMARLLTSGRLELLALLRERPYPVRELAAALKRDVRAVSRDVDALEEHRLVRSKLTINPGHGRVRIVSAPRRIKISAEI